MGASSPLGFSPVPVCAACVGRVSPNELPACGTCGEALDLEIDFEDIRFAGQMAATLRCRECRMAPPAFERAVSYGTYEGELRALIGLLKFDGVTGVAGLLSERLAQAMLTLQPADMLIVAVPLFSARERQRGYNQSALLCDRALRHVRKARPEWKLTPSHALLKRIRRTESQYVLSKQGRRRNLRGAFAVTGDVHGHDVMIVDDIMTSGATARECARVLKAAGAARVWVVTLARAQKAAFVRTHVDPGDQVARWDA